MQQERILSASDFNAFLAKVFLWMFTGLIVTGTMAMITISSPALLSFIFSSQLTFFGLIIGEFALVFYLSARAFKLPKQKAVGFFLLYAALNGVTLSAIFLIYSGSQLFTAFFVTAIIFLTMAAYGYITKTDLTAFRSFFIMALVGVIAASVLNMFLQSGGLSYAISIISVLLFAGLTAYDLQVLKQYYVMTVRDGSVSVDGVAVHGALRLYLDFINLFLSILRLMRRR